MKSVGRFSLTLVGVLLLGGAVRAQDDVVLDFTFDGATIDPVTQEVRDFDDEPIGQALNNTIVDFSPNGDGDVISLTQGQNDQSGFVWFNNFNGEEQVNLREQKVTIQFDSFIRTGTSADPADGMSIIFQFGNNTSLTGGGGGGLGTGGLTDYVSVAFDIWDNGGNDPETPCDVGNRTCHIEVNQNSNPGADPSLANSTIDLPSFTDVGDAGVPMRMKIVFDAGFISVSMLLLGDEAGDPDAWDAFIAANPQFDSFVGERGDEGVTVIRTKLNEDQLPDPAAANAIIGFAASTGGANAFHEVDNLLVSLGDVSERVSETLTLGEMGAINCGSNTEVIGTVDGTEYTFVPDVQFGTFLEEQLDPPLVRDIFSGYGHVSPPNFAAVGAAISNLEDAALEPMYQSEAWQNGSIQYRFDVPDGRYEVTLHFAENCACGVNADGEGTRIYNVQLESEAALDWFSPGAAAGEDTGAGAAVLNTAARRTFEVDVVDGALNVFVSDLGLLTNPPENAQINGINYRRLGDATGAALSGFQEGQPPTELPVVEEALLLSADEEGSFDDVDPGTCPEDWTCNGTMPAQTLDGIDLGPQVVDFSGLHAIEVNPRLRLTDNGGGLVGNAFYNEPVDLSKNGFEAEFDVHFTRDPAVGVADGLTFLFVPGDDSVLTLQGGTGGAIGYSGLGVASGFAVEFDSWNGGGDPNGLNSGTDGHVGVVVNSDVTQHIQHNISYDASLVGDNWPFGLITDPASPSVNQFKTGTFDLEADGTAGMHCRVRLNNNRIQVFVSTVNQEPGIGFVYPETKVIDTSLDFGSNGLGTGFFGFSAGTGGAVAWHEVDNVNIRLLRTQVLSVTRSVSASVYDVNTTGIDVTLDVDLDDDAPTPLSIELEELLPANWGAEGISDGGSFADGAISWTLADLGADTQLTYTLVPPDGASSSISLTGTFNVNDTVPQSIGSTTISFAPLPFGRGEPEVLVSEDFELGDLPPGASANGGHTDVNFPDVVLPRVDQFTGRLRMAEDGVTNTGTSVFFTEPVDLLENSFTVEFDAFFYSNIGSIADGLVFAVIDPAVNAPTDVGAAGGGMGYLGLSGFGVEVDMWQGPDTGPSGYNVAERFAHVAVVRDGIVAEHVQTHLDFNPELRPLDIDPLAEGWPTIVDESLGGDGSDQQLRFRIEYNNGNIEAFISAAETLGGPAVDELQILDTVVTFENGAGRKGVDGGDPVLPSGYLGFTAGTGGAHATMEIDNLLITTYPKTDGPGGPQFRRGDVDGSGVVDISDPIANLTNQFLGGPIPCRDAADYNDSGAVDISDPIANLTNQFLGGPPAAPPGSETCGPDPTADAGADGGDLGCENPPTNC